MKFIKQHIVKIELSAILILVMLLCIQTGDEPEYEASVLDAQHNLPIISVVVEKEEADKQEEVKVQVMGATTVGSTLLENVEKDDNGLSPEVQDRYDAAVNYTIPENIAFANVQESLSIRKSPNGESEQIGIMYPGNYCIIESVDGEWAKVKTGSVTGYSRVKYLIRGEDAVAYAKAHVICTVKSTANVNIRSSATTQEDNIITTVTAGKSFPVTNPAVISEDPTTPLFVELTYEGKTAYMAMSLAKLSYSWTEGQAYKEPVKVEVQGTTVEKDDPAESTGDVKEEVTTDKETTTESETTEDTTTDTTELRNSIVAAAKDALGVKYVYGGNSLSSGVDCSGFVHQVFKKVGADVIYNLPRTSNGMSKSTWGKKITYEEARPGDLMFYGSGGKKTVDHVAIYIGDGKIIHASSVDKKVVIEDWDYRIPLVIRNFLG